jgi:hypothetical protein
MKTTEKNKKKAMSVVNRRLANLVRKINAGIVEGNLEYKVSFSIEKSVNYYKFIIYDRNYMNPVSILGGKIFGNKITFYYSARDGEYKENSDYLWDAYIRGTYDLETQTITHIHNKKKYPYKLNIVDKSEEKELSFDEREELAKKEIEKTINKGIEELNEEINKL